MECKYNGDNSPVAKQPLDYETFCKWLDLPNVKSYIEGMGLTYKGKYLIHDGVKISRKEFLQSVNDGFISIDINGEEIDIVSNIYIVN